MRTLTKAGVILLALGLLAGCSSEKSVSNTEAAALGGHHFTLNLVPGNSYHFTSWWFIFPVQIYPQVACWLESADGSYLGTIYATSKAAKNSWMSAPKEGRPEALPVWTHVKEAREADTISSATPSGAAEPVSDLAADLKPGSYVVKLEINRSYDYNDTYTKANSGVVGQPSLIYQCSIQVGGSASKASFVPIGTGALDGSDGKIRPGLDGITTALHLLDTAEISYE